MRGMRGATGNVLVILCLMYFITYFDRVNISTAAPVISKELGLNNTELGYVFSAFAWPYALFQLFGGWLGDRFGPRRTLGVCGSLWSLATAVTGLAGGIVSLFLARLMLGFGEGAAFPTATRAMASWTTPDQRGFAQGITHAFSRLANAVASPIVVFLIALLTWRGSFVVMGAISFIWVIVWYGYFRDDPRDHAAITEAELARLPTTGAKGRSEKVVPWGRLFARILPVTLVDFCYGWILWVYLNWIPSFFVHSYGLNLKTSSFFTAGVLVAGLVGDTVGGVASDIVLRRTGSVLKARRNVIVLGFLGCFAFTLPLVFIHDLNTAALCLAGAFFFSEFIVAPIWAVPMDIAPQYAGTASGLMNFGFGLAGIISPVVFGKIIDVTGSWNVPFVCSLALVLVGAGLSFRLRPDLPFIDDRPVAGLAAAGKAAS
jgi:MFS family permease